MNAICHIDVNINRRFISLFIVVCCVFAKLALSLTFCSVIGLDTLYSCYVSPITSLVVWLFCFFFLLS